MKDDQKRYGKALITSLCIHVGLCLILAVCGLSFNNRSSQILEVTLEAGPPPKLGSSNVTPVEQPKEKVVVPQEDDIVEEKEDIPKTEEVKQIAQPTPVKTSGDPNGVKNGVEGGKGTNADSVGTGSGEKHGVPATPPRVISSYKPTYPASAKKDNIEGTVYVKVLINEKGEVEDSFLFSTSGNSALDDAAVQAMYKWRFVAAKDGFGRYCSCYITIPINFNLR